MQGICGFGNKNKGYTGADFTLLVPGLVLSDVNTTTTRTVIKAFNWSYGATNVTINYNFDPSNGVCGNPFCHPACGGYCWARNNSNACQTGSPIVRHGR